MTEIYETQAEKWYSGLSITSAVLITSAALLYVILSTPEANKQKINIGYSFFLILFSGILILITIIIEKTGCSFSNRTNYYPI